jgi:small subunit ribosomal protein S4
MPTNATAGSDGICELESHEKANAFSCPSSPANAESACCKEVGICGTGHECPRFICVPAIRPRLGSGLSAPVARRRRRARPAGEKPALVSGEEKPKMTKRVSAKHKIDRRMGENIWGRPKSPLNKREYGPGQHGQRRRGKTSDYGAQLKAKQKLKGYYANIGERQFKTIYLQAARLKGDTSEQLIGLLESRLDAIVYRAKFVPTMHAARQLVNHGHVKVNGRRVTVPSYRCKVGDEIALKDKARELPMVLDAGQSPERETPDYLQVDHNKQTAHYARMPAFADVPYPVKMEPHLVVEFYSR